MNQDNPPLVMIEDGAGEPVSYEVLRLDSEPDGHQTTQLRRVDSDEIYVARSWRGQHGCTCADWRYRKPVGGCKHVRWLNDHFEETSMNENLPATVIETTAALTAPTNGLPMTIPNNRANLARSIVAAQQRCRSVVKDSTNNYHRYRYASAESIIEEGKSALASAGVALVPMDVSLNRHVENGESNYELERKFVVLDSASGEMLAAVVHWPVCPEKGRPLDKAMAIADTLSLSYYLRDLLLMPRVDQADDVAAREDHEQAAQPATTAAPTPSASEANGCISDGQADLIAGRIRDWQIDPKAFLERYQIPVIRKLPAMHWQDTGKWLDQQGNLPITKEQAARMDTLQVQCEISNEDFTRKIKDKFGADDPWKLTRQIAARIISQLETSLSLKHAQTGATT